VIALAPHLPPPAERTVDRPGEADREPLQAAHEGTRVVGLDDEVDVRLLHREVHDAEAPARALRQRRAQGEEDAGLAQGRQARARPQRDVRRVVAVVRRARAVGHAAAAAGGSAAGAGPAPAPGPGDELELCGSRSHLE
jgi:hypothetical protein